MSTSHYIPAGRLSRTIELQRATTTIDDAGSPVKTWAKLALVKAELVEQATSDERVTDLGRVSREMALFRMRYIPGVTLSDRVVYDENAFRITKIAEIGIRRGLEITVERFAK